MFTNHRLSRVVLAGLVLAIVIVACGGSSPGPHPWARSDMPIAGLDRLITYRLEGPASSETLVNEAENRGVNNTAPLLVEDTIFHQMSGTKTQDVEVTLPDSRKAQSLGMAKTKRFAGLSQYMRLEPATYWAIDNNGQVICGAKVRLDFKKNLFQIMNDAQAKQQKDYQSLWYYVVPCKLDGAVYNLDIQHAEFYALVLNEVWQFRVAGGSYFFNWGHSVTSLNGLPAIISSGWWEHFDIPDDPNDVTTTYDAVGAAKMVNSMVTDLESSPMPWLEYTPGGAFDNSGTYLIYSAGDADKYATWDRVLLDRQTEYAVFYRPSKEATWDYIRVQPLYNLEWNDVQQNLQALYGWTFDGHLNEQGVPGANDSVAKELERVGWINAPNAALDQVRWYDSAGNLLYTMTVRAHIGAKDTLIMFSRGEPDLGLRNQVRSTDNQPWPALHDANGNPLPPEQQPYTVEQWAEWQREVTFWDFLKDNPDAVGADLEVQYRFTDNSTWKEVMCTRYDDDGKAVSYVCGYEPVQWDLSTSYYFDGDVRGPWLAIQTLGEVGVRTLGFSYASGLYEGTGLAFALAQEVHRQEYYTGYPSVESLWRFDARASQLPDTLRDAIAFLKEGH